MYLVDTDVVVSYLNGRPDAVTLVSALLPDGIAISTITFGEVCEGSTLAVTPPATWQASAASYAVCACWP